MTNTNLKYEIQSTNESGKYKVRRANNGLLIPDFVLRHSYIAFSFGLVRIFN